MIDQDPLRRVLREWEAPETPATLDAKALHAFRASRRPPIWQRFWTFRVSIPVPVLAVALLLIAASVWMAQRNAPPSRPAAPSGYITRLESAGFQPLPDGATRVIRGGIRQ